MLIEVGKRYVLNNGMVTGLMAVGDYHGASCFVAADSTGDNILFDKHGTAYDADGDGFDVKCEYVEKQQAPCIPPVPEVGKRYLMECGGTVVFTGVRADGRLIGIVNLGAGLKYPDVFEANGTAIKSPGFRIVQEIGNEDVDVTISFDSDDMVTKKCGSAEPQMRTFAGGATRNLDTNKLDYDGFFCPLVMKRFAEYMHSHRMQKDGTMRAADNWQTGIPYDVYIKSMFRHFMDARLLHKGQKPLSPEDGHEIDIEEALCAVLFNVQGYLHEVLKARSNA